MASFKQTASQGQKRFNKAAVIERSQMLRSTSQQQTFTGKQKNDLQAAIVQRIGQNIFVEEVSVPVDMVPLTDGGIDGDKALENSMNTKYEESEGYNMRGDGNSIEPISEDRKWGYTEEESIVDALMKQVDVLKLDAKEKAVAQAMFQNINEFGFLPDENKVAVVEVYFEQYGITKDGLSSAELLEKIRNKDSLLQPMEDLVRELKNKLSPAGILASDVKDNFIVQINRSEDFNRLEKRTLLLLVNKNYEDVLKLNLDAVKSALNQNNEIKIEKVYNAIKSLKKYPIEVEKNENLYTKERFPEFVIRKDEIAEKKLAELMTDLKYGKISETDYTEKASKLNLYVVKALPKTEPEIKLSSYYFRRMDLLREKVKNLNYSEYKDAKDKLLASISNPETKPELKVTAEIEIQKLDRVNPIQAEFHFMERELAKVKEVQALLEDRRKTIENVLTFVANKQTDYMLQNNVEKINVLTMTQVASDLNKSVTDISNIINNKVVINTNGEVMEFRGFFDKGVQLKNGQNVSIGNVITEVRTRLENESPRQPITDIQLATELQKIGYKVSAKRVTTIRESLGFEDAAMRAKTAKFESVTISNSELVKSEMKISSTD